MKIIKEAFIILAISLVGEVLKNLIPLPIPASIYGFVILFVGLYTHIIPIEKVKTTADFLIEIMPLMFIPAAVGLLVSGKALTEILLPFILIVCVSTVIVIGTSGAVTQWSMKGAKAKEESDNEGAI